MQFRKKPVVIEAEQWNGTYPQFKNVIAPFCPTAKHYASPFGLDSARGLANMDEPVLLIPTLEGDHIAIAGDWIIKGVAGEFYPCKPDIFAKTYEPA